jgi:hypothetical protein
MGHEHDIQKDKCGCEHHHEYDEACGMGGYNDKYWDVRCTDHEIEHLQKKLAGLREQVNKVEDEIRTLERKRPREEKAGNNNNKASK